MLIIFPSMETSTTQCHQVIAPMSSIDSVPKRILNSEGAGFSQFNNLYLLTSIVLAPLAVNLLLPLSLSWYPVLLVLLALPLFAAFNMLWVIYVEPTISNKLPGKPIEEYLTILDPELKQQYRGNAKIPMETFFEAYFDGKIDLKMPGQVLELLESRYDWASFRFTLGQAKFFVTQWIPELLVHSRKQDEDQVREHYDRGDDFYQAFCIFYSMDY